MNMNENVYMQYETGIVPRASARDHADPPTGLADGGTDGMPRRRDMKHGVEGEVGGLKAKELAISPRQDARKAVGGALPATLPGALGGGRRAQGGPTGPCGRLPLPDEARPTRPAAGPMWAGRMARGPHGRLRKPALGRIGGEHGPV